jgi:hypothetical protein
MQTRETKGYPLSLQQADVWARRERRPVCGTQCAIWVKGPLHVEILCQALDTLVQRHEMLRTSFVRLPEMDLPIQVILRLTRFCRVLERGS